MFRSPAAVVALVFCAVVASGGVFAQPAAPPPAPLSPVALQGDAVRALALARTNFEVQREVADARALLEAALVARDPAAAEPALQWVRTHGVQSVALRRLEERLGAVK